MKAIAGGTAPGRHVCNAMYPSMMPATAASDHAPIGQVSPNEGQGLPCRQGISTSRTSIGSVRSAT